MQISPSNCFIHYKQANIWWDTQHFNTFKAHNQRTLSKYFSACNFYLVPSIGCFRQLRETRWSIRHLEEESLKNEFRHCFWVWFLPGYRFNTQKKLDLLCVRVWGSTFVCAGQLRVCAHMRESEALVFSRFRRLRESVELVLSLTRTYGPTILAGRELPAEIDLSSNNKWGCMVISLGCM